MSSVNEQASASNSFFREAFHGLPVMAILRGFDADKTVEASERAWTEGINLVEVPIQDPSALEALRAAVTAGRTRSKVVGAGTVTTVERVRLAADAGAAFTVAPGFEQEVAAASLAAGMPHLAGVASPAEIQQAMKLGLTWLKAFPAAELGSSWITAMGGPFPESKFVATGGISVQNAEEFLTAGAGAVSLGSALTDPRQLEQLPGLVAAIRKKAQQ